MADVRPGPFRESIGITIDTSAIGPYLKSKSGAIRKALADKMTYTSGMMKLRISKKLETGPIYRKSGNAAASVRGDPTEVSPSEILGGVTAGGENAPEVRWLEYGTQPHDIAPLEAFYDEIGVSGAGRILRSRATGPRLFVQRRLWRGVSPTHCVSR